MSEDEPTEDDETPVDRFDVPEGDDGAGDPFERLEEGSGRQGDPFERLEDADQPDAGEAGAGAADRGGPGGHEVTNTTDTSSGTEPGVPDPPGSTSRSPGEDDPFADFDPAGGDPFDGTENVFAGAESDDGVWERMDDARDAQVQQVPGRRYVEVSKHSYCEQCEYFSSPIEISCSHEGTEILEFTDMETVRVINCPVVEERRALQDEG